MIFVSKESSVMTQGPRKNPYRPGVGTRPLHIAGRDGPIGRFQAMLRAAPEQPANMRLTGLRGVGKTVLLDVFAERAEEQGWAAGFLELQPAHNTDDGAVEAISGLDGEVRERVSRTARLRAAAGKAAQRAGTLTVVWGDVAVSFAAGDAKQVELAKDLFETVDLAVGKGRDGLILLLDEAQVIRDERAPTGEHPLSLLISSVVGLQRREAPLGFVVCGLPTLTSNLLRARSYTERMFRGEEIDSLGHDEALTAFTKPLEGGPVAADSRVAEAVVEEVEGYPYFIQLWGSELWDAAQAAETDEITPELLEAARPEIHRRLDIDFYEPRVATLTPAEQDVLLATAECSYPPLVVSEMNEAVDKTPANINVLLGRLVEAGVLYRVRKAQYEYTAPQFREYLLRRLARDQVRAA